MTKKIVLAYSGGLDTSVAIHWLKNRYKARIIAFCADLGQGEDLAALREKATRTGASKVYIEDVREEFVREYVFPMLRANAVYEGVYLLGTSIARPLIAKRQIEIADMVGADAVCHGATGKGNDQVRFELSAYAPTPTVFVRGGADTGPNVPDQIDVDINAPAGGTGGGGMSMTTWARTLPIDATASVATMTLITWNDLS